jgi:DNA-binding XRE family transcriptional regulator
MVITFLQCDSAASRAIARGAGVEPMNYDTKILRVAAQILRSRGFSRDAARISRLAGVEQDGSNELGSFFLRYRSRYCLTQQSMADRIGLPLSTYLTVEYGSHSPSRRTLDIIGTFLAKLDQQALKTLGPLPEYVNTKVA